jgi:hypothetical protein
MPEANLLLRAASLLGKSRSSSMLPRDGEEGVGGCERRI